MAGAEQFRIAQADRAEGAIAAGRDDEVEVALSFLMVDPHFGFVHPGEGIAAFRQGGGERVAPFEDFVSIDRVADLGRKGGAQRRFAAGGFSEARDIHRGEQILGAGRDGEPHGEPIAARWRRGDGTADARGIIALGPQQPVEQIAIFLDAAVDLGEVGGLVLALAQDRQFIEAQLKLRVGDGVDAVQCDGIAAFLADFGKGGDGFFRLGIGGDDGDRHVRPGGLHIGGVGGQRYDGIGLAHVRPVETDVGHGV